MRKTNDTDKPLQQAQLELVAAQAMGIGFAKALRALLPAVPRTMAGVEWDHDKHHLVGAECDGEPAVMISPCGGDGMSRSIALISLGDGFFLEESDEYVVPNGKRYELREVGATVSSDENVSPEQHEQPERSYTVQTSDENPPTEKSWVEVDDEGMYREDYMEWKPWKWYALEGEPLTLEEAVNAVRAGAGYKRPYRINRGEEVVLTIFPEPEAPEVADKPAHPEVLETVEDYQNAPEGTIISRPGGYPWIKEDGLWRSPSLRESSESLVLDWNQPFNVLRWGGGA